MATDASLAGVSGKYFVSRKQHPPPAIACDVAVQQRVWDVLVAQTGAEWSI